MTTAPNRPWYRLHWLTWLILALVIWAMVERERAMGGDWRLGSLQYLLDTEFGWPKVHLTVVESGWVFPTPGELPTFTYKWDYTALSFNSLFCLLLAVTTAHVFELWLRSPNRLHMSLSSLLGLIGVAGILTGIVNNNFDDLLDWLGLARLNLVNSYRIRQPAAWPVVIALGCTVYSLGWLAIAASFRLFSLSRSPRA